MASPPCQSHLLCLEEEEEEDEDDDDVGFMGSFHKSLFGHFPGSCAAPAASRAAIWHLYNSNEEHFTTPIKHIFVSYNSNKEHFTTPIKHILQLQ